MSLRCTMCWFDTFVYFNMIITVMLANTSITSLRCQYGSRRIRKVTTWGGGAEEQEGAWNSSVKGQIIKAVGFAGSTVSVKSCSTKAALDNMQINGHGPVRIKLYKNKEGDSI